MHAGAEVAMTEAEWLSSKIPRAMLDAFRPASHTQYLRNLKPEDRAKASQLDRKLRLFSCACVRRVWHLLEDERSLRAVEVSERYADRMASPEELDAALDGANDASGYLYRKGGLLAAEAARLENPEAEELPTASVFGEKHEERAWKAATAAEAVARRKLGHPRTKEVFESAWPAADMASRSASDAISGNAELRTREESYWASFEADRAKECRYYEDSWQSDLLRCIFGNPFRPVSLDPDRLTSESVLLAESIKAGRAFHLMMDLGDALEASGCDDVEVLGHCRKMGDHARGCWVIDAVLGVG